MSLDKQFISKSKLAKRWDKTPRTIDRWIANPPAGFPDYTVINGHKVFDLEEVASYERNSVAKRAA